MRLAFDGEHVWVHVCRAQVKNRGMQIAEVGR